MIGDTDDALDFEPLFDLRGGVPEPASGQLAVARPDSREGMVYRMPAALHLAVEVALTTGRPLLLRGEPGTGKSSLAPYVARRLGWRYYEQVVTSTSSAADLLWRFDAVRRLGDAQAGTPKHETHYLEPGVLWWALDRASALEHAQRSGVAEPQAVMNSTRNPHRAVVLIDEIDKAHPDLPNGLLVALGSNQITIPHLPSAIVVHLDDLPPLDLPRALEVAPVQVIVTTNEERELPAAFIRRCITYLLEHPKALQLVDIARAHFDTAEAPFSVADETLAQSLAKRVETLRAQAGLGEHRPSTAEFIDAFRACRKRGIAPGKDDPRWALIERIALVKPALEPLG